MATVNELLRDSLIRRQIYLLRFSTKLTNDIIRLLDETEADLRDKLAKYIEAHEGEFRTKTEARMKVVAEIIKSTRGAAFAQAEEVWTESLAEVAASEVKYLDEAIHDYSPVVLETVVPAATQLGAIVRTQPFEGEIMQDWARKLEKAESDRILQQIRIGITQGETTPQISRRITGTAKLNGADGITQITRRNAEAITRTATNFIANAAKQAYYQANSDLVEREQYLATLDSRTTPVCRARDGEVYERGKGPIPPLHFGCRSLRVPLLSGDYLGDRPAVAASKRDLDGLSQKARRAKLREMTGQVPAETTYNDWLKRQTAAFQDDVLGPTRADLFRKGGLSLDRFVDNKGREYTLDELRRREPAAFKRAGL